MRVNHKIGKDIGIKPIKLENHKTCKEIDEILYEVNDLLYFFSFLYLNSSARATILASLKTNAEKLKALSFPRATSTEWNARRDEILQKMREIYRSVEKEVDIEDDVNWDACLIKMSKMKMSMFLKDKQENKLDDKTIYNWLTDNLYFTKVYGVTPQIKSIQDELLNHFKI